MSIRSQRAFLHLLTVSSQLSADAEQKVWVGCDDFCNAVIQYSVVCRWKSDVNECNRDLESYGTYSFLWHSTPVSSSAHMITVLT